MANTAVGEIAVIVNGQSYLLRPSFLAMQKIGDPDDIYAAAEFCNSAKQKMHNAEAASVAELAYCLDVIEACAISKIPNDIFGYLIYEGANVKYKSGKENQESLIVIACALLKDGIFGKPDKARMRRKSNAPDKKFDPIDFVATIMSPNGLNKSSDDAWAMTMIEFQRVFDATFPLPEKERNQMTADDLRALRARLKGVKK